jgi:hypothetical protein
LCGDPEGVPRVVADDESLESLPVPFTGGRVLLFLLSIKFLRHLKHMFISNFENEGAIDFSTTTDQDLIELAEIDENWDPEDDLDWDDTDDEWDFDDLHDEDEDDEDEEDDWDEDDDWDDDDWEDDHGWDELDLDEDEDE